MNPVERVKLGRTDVEVTRLGLGTAPLGGWPAARSREEATATISRAWDVGVRYFDTAPYYGHGLSEEHLGAVLPGHERSEFVVSTKVGRLLIPGDPGDAFFKGVPQRIPTRDYSYEGTLRSLEESLDRLGLDSVEIALIHDPDDHHAEALEGAYRALLDLREQGRVKAIGAGMNRAEPLADFVREGDFDCMLMAGRYTLLEQHSLDTLLPVALERRIGIVAGGVFNGGLLVDPGPTSTYNYEPAPPEIIERAKGLESVCRTFDVPLRAAAIQFPLAHPAITTIVVGACSPQEVDDNIAMLQLGIPPELWSDLKEHGLVREDAPTP
jgi:D-threo-aldose 1-dehydrogenase